MVTLYNVIDIRTNQFYSVAVVKEVNRKWYIYARKSSPEVSDGLE